MARYPYDVIDDYYVEETFDDLADLDSDEIESSGGSSVGFDNVSDIEKIHIHELLNRWMYVVMHYWNVTIEDVKSYLSFVEDNIDQDQQIMT